MGGALGTGRVQFERAEPPWADPMPAYAVARGYADFRADQGGFVVAGAADRVFDRSPPDPAGPLVVDRRHSSKQPEDQRLGLTDYGYSRMHGFGRAFDPVRAAGVPLRPERGVIDAEVLSGASGLFVNLPSGDNPGFRASEVRAIESFVRHGGGLLLISDHSNCYFHGEMLAPLGRALGFALPPATATDRGPGHTLSPASVAWLRVAARPGHPVTDGVAHFAMVTAGVIEPGEGQVVLARTSGAGWVDHWTPYRREDSAGFTGDLVQQPDEPDAAAAVAVAGEHGGGRFVVLADQNAFGDGFVGYEDTSRLFANAVAWTTRRQVPVSLRDADSVTTLAGPRSLCTAAAPYAYRTLQVSLQRVAEAAGMREYCTVDGDVASRARLVLPEAIGDPLGGAARVVALVDAAQEGSRRLVDRLGLTLGAGTGRGDGLRWIERLPAPPHPIFDGEPAEETLSSAVPSLTGAFRSIAVDGEGRPVVVAVTSGDTEVLLLLDGSLLDNAHLKGERTDPGRQVAAVQASHRLAFHLLAWLAQAPR